MQSIRQIQRLNDTELEKCVAPNASWHTDYRDTAYIYIGGLPFELSEGDVLTIFSQYGNPVHINLMRDKDTGKSRGFAWLKYEDQKSCDLAVDNLSGAGVLGRVLSVDHTRYKLKDDEIEGQGLEDDRKSEEEDDTDREGESRRKRRRTSSAEGQRPVLKEEQELAQLLKDHDQDDPMKAYLIKEKKEEVAEALRHLSVSKSSKDDKRNSHHSHRHRDEERRHRHRSRDRDRGDDREKTSRRQRERDDEEKASRRERAREDDEEKASRRQRERSPDRDDRQRRNRSRSSSEHAERRRRDRREEDRGHSRRESRRSRSRELRRDKS